MKIVHFDKKNFEELLAFSKKIWPEKSEEYLRFRLFKFPEQTEDNRYNFLVKNDEDRIIGCTLYFPTRALIKGKEEKVFWGHDMYVEEQYRGLASLFLITEQLKIKTSFGFGQTEINKKIQKGLGAKFIDAADLYFIINIWSFKVLLFKFKLIKANDISKNRYPEKLTIGKYTFSKISDVRDLKIPGKGFWCHSMVDIEFVRNEHFLRTRFFENFIEYHFYKLDTADPIKDDECYFVARRIIKKGIPLLSIADFRYNLAKPEQLTLILKAGSRLARYNKLPLSVIRTSHRLHCVRLQPILFKTFSQQQIITYYSVNTKVSTFVTDADGDSDFLVN
jgi:hypothetical protein